jgi:hypothetical protein
MSKKLRIMELGNAGKAFLATFIGAIIGGKVGKVKALKRKMKAIDDELSDELDVIQKKVLASKARYEKQIKGMTPAQKKKFDSDYAGG